MLHFPSGASGKESACQCRRCKRCRFEPWVRKIPWRRKWQPAPVFLPGESHGQRSLVAMVHRIEKSRTRLKRLSTNIRVFIMLYIYKTTRAHNMLIVDRIVDFWFLGCFLSMNVNFTHNISFSKEIAVHCNPSFFWSSGCSSKDSYAAHILLGLPSPLESGSLSLSTWLTVF